MVLLDNCIAALPEEIGECKLLRFLSLPNNKQLKSLPNSISTLPNLFFLNVKGSPDCKIPPSVLKRAEDMCDGCGMYDLAPIDSK
jgi:hypothetical protein